MNFEDEFILFKSTSEKIKIRISSDIPDLLIKHPIIIQIQRYPQFTWLDLYKLIHQSACGWAHLTKKGKLPKIQQYLKTELNSVGKPKPDEPLFELLDEETKLGRVNLRVWRQIPSFTCEDLWQIMLESNDPKKTCKKAFLQKWHLVQEWVDHKYLKFTKFPHDWQIKKDFDMLDKIGTTLDLAIPLVSHSDLYRTAHQPHYRIVDQRCLYNFLANRQ